MLMKGSGARNDVDQDHVMECAAVMASCRRAFAARASVTSIASIMVRAAPVQMVGRVLEGMAAVYGVQMRPTCNRDAYAQMTPPVYDMAEIRTPLALFTGRCPGFAGVPLVQRGIAPLWWRLDHCLATCCGCTDHINELLTCDCWWLLVMPAPDHHGYLCRNTAAPQNLPCLRLPL